MSLRYRLGIPNIIHQYTPRIIKIIITWNFIREYLKKINERVEDEALRIKPWSAAEVQKLVNLVK